MIRFIDEYRHENIAKVMAHNITRCMDHMAKGHPINLMEVCGSHTNAIFKFGIRDLLPDTLHLLSGPGCPVCVTPNWFIDAAIELARRPGVIVATFGDMIRVPGSRSSLLAERARGRDIRICLSPSDAVAIADNNPHKKTVFLGIGFETTAPAIAVSIIEAEKKGITRYSVLSALKTIPNALRILVEADDVNIHGFICPGHVSVITGLSIYRPIAEQYGIPCVVSGFEPADILCSIDMIVRQIAENRAVVENQYTRTVREEGNRTAQAIMDKVLTPCDSRWRGIGTIPGSGLSINDTYADFDALRIFSIELSEERETPGCICGQIMRGAKTPLQCTLFAKICTPEDPKGACMVSAEGTCAAYYRYRK